MKKIHSVDLLESATLSFDDEEVDNAGSDEQARCKHVAVTEVNIMDDERGKEGKEEIPACRLLVCCTANVLWIEVYPSY